MRSSDELSGLEQMFDHLKSAYHTRRKNIARRLFHPLLDDLDAARTTSCCEVRGRLDCDNAVECPRGRREGRKRPKPRPNLKQRAARYIEPLHVAYNAFKPRPMNLFPTRCLRRGENVLSPICVVL